MKSLICYRDIKKGESFFQFASIVLGSLESDIVLLGVRDKTQPASAQDTGENYLLLPDRILEKKTVQAGFLRAIIEETKKNLYDLVVIISQDQPTIEELLLGTIADRVVKAANTSVLIVNHPKRALKRLLVSTGGHELSDQTVDTGITIAEKIQTKVILLHVVASFPSMYAGLDRIDESLEEVLHTDTPLARHLKEKAADMIQKGIDAQIELRHGLPSEEIVRATYRDEADLLVIGYSEDTRFYRLFRDHLSLDIVDRAGCPVLVVNRKTPW
jgi:nucleotide-binding universal stress UspA family protein